MAKKPRRSHFPYLLAGVAAVCATAIVLALSLLHRQGQRTSGKGGVPVRVAVIDTGYAASLWPSVEAPLTSDEQAAISPSLSPDVDGHGTRVAGIITREAPGVSVHPVKVSERGFFVTALALARALQAACDLDAAIINVSFGIQAPDPGDEGSVALAQALDRVRAEHRLLVTAVGVGIANPFKPTRLSRVLPQAWPGAIVVGTALEAGGALHPDRSENFGWGTDVAVVLPAGRTGSSFAAPSVSAALARAMISGDIGRTAGVEVARYALRAASEPLPYYWLTSRGHEREPRGGYGILVPKNFENQGISATKGLECRFARSTDKVPRAVLLLQATEPLESVEIVAQRGACAGTAVGTEAGARAKGVAAVIYPKFDPSKDCPVRVRIRTSGTQAIVTAGPLAGCELAF